MAITSNDILQNVLISIDRALQNPELSDDSRGALIEQYERTSDLIVKGYENISVGLDDLPTTIRNETIELVNSVTQTFETASQSSLDEFNDALALLKSHNVTISESNSILDTVVSKSNEINSDLSAFDMYLIQLEQDKQVIQTFKNQIDSYVVPTNVTYSETELDDDFANIGNNILKIQQDFLGLKINIKVV